LLLIFAATGKINNDDEYDVNLQGAAKNYLSLKTACNRFIFSTRFITTYCYIFGTASRYHKIRTEC